MKPILPSRRAWWTSLVLVVGAALLVRMPVWATYAPVPANDTGSYETVAHMIASGDFSGYDAMRTPGYPLFMLACGMRPGVMWAVQSLMGIAAAAFAFLMASRLARGLVMPVLAGLSVALATNLVFFESLLQSETLALALILLGSWLAQRALLGGHDRAAVLAGVVLAFAALVRPLYFVLGPVGALGAALLLGPRRWRIALSLLAPVVTVYLGLSAFNYAKVGYFGGTTHLGLHLFNHTIGFAESASDRYAEVREIAIRQRDAHRDELLVNDDNRAFTRGYATAEMQERFGLDAVALCKLLQGFSFDAILRNPVAYGWSVAITWLRFWRVPLVMYPEPFRSRAVERVYAALWWPVKLWWLGLNIAFLLLGPPILLRLRRPDPVAVSLATLWLMVIAASVVQALIEYSDNSRYWVPTAPLVAVVVFAGWDYLRRARSVTP